jgi:GMP synthase (glutamine-hydrolysing)
MKRVLLLKPGVTSSRASLGDYEQWFQAALEPESAALVPVELHARQSVPSLARFDAIIMSGSPLSVTALHGDSAATTEGAEWMRRAADVMIEASERMPVLGVCFGHQLLAWRLGSVVHQNPKGKELGTVSVVVTSRGQTDPLFDGLPSELAVQATHDDEVKELPPGARLLATNAASTVQAFGFGKLLRAVQFHPEMTCASIRFCIEHDEALAGEAKAALLGAAHDSTHGATLLRNFIARW